MIGRAIGLAAVGAALAALSLVVVSIMTARYREMSGPVSVTPEELEAWAREQAFAATLSLVAEPLMTAGLVAIVGALVLLALRSRSRRAPAAG